MSTPSTPAIAALPTVLLRPSGKLFGGSLAARVAGVSVTTNLGLHLTSPGIFGVALAINAARALGDEASLLLTVGGYWAGRFGEATSNHQNQRARILIAVTVLTIGVEIGSLVVHVFLGDPASFGSVVGRVLLPSLALNLALDPQR